jgi:hypothetical protein
MTYNRFILGCARFTFLLGSGLIAIRVIQGVKYPFSDGWPQILIIIASLFLIMLSEKDDQKRE